MAEATVILAALNLALTGALCFGIWQARSALLKVLYAIRQARRR
jgi:hypothetical protein